MYFISVIVMVFVYPNEFVNAIPILRVITMYLSLGR